MTWEEEVVLLRAENAALRERIGELEQQIAELEERKRRLPSFVKPNRAKSTEVKGPHSRCFDSRMLMGYSLATIQELD